MADDMFINLFHGGYSDKKFYTFLDLNGIKPSLVPLEIAVSSGCCKKGLLSIAIGCRFKKKNLKAKQAASYHIEH